MVRAEFRWGFFYMAAIWFMTMLGSCNSGPANRIIPLLNKEIDTLGDRTINNLLLIPKNPIPGEPFRILATGGKNIGKAKLEVNGPDGKREAQSIKLGEELPYWRLDDFTGGPSGNYMAVLLIEDKEVCKLEFSIDSSKQVPPKGGVWKTTQGWDNAMETLYSAWVNALFQGCSEQESWNALHEVTQNKDRNFLFNYLSLDEDNPEAKIKVIMEPDCADNPFYLRAYFAWKMGLPFGCHVCDRGYLGRNPQAGAWMTNEISTSKSHPVLAFNSFLRSIMNWVHSGTARTALDNQKSDYYPVSLNREALRPGTVFADPYGHTLTIVSWVPQTNDRPGRMLAVDAQPDKSIAIKRFWKGNFLFNTTDVVGEPGFKAFRPIAFDKGKLSMLPFESMTDSAGYPPFSLQQRKMESEEFYHTMERIINPNPLKPEVALTDLIQALHEQLLVRVKSVATGEAYMQSHPGALIPMPSHANGVFQALGQWEDFSTPNRDLRLLIAMDAVLAFPERVARYPEDYEISNSFTVDENKKRLQQMLNEKVDGLSITYIRSDGSEQKLTLAEILQRRDAFEMGYNPNDGVEIRWGAPENSEERSTCRRQAPAYQKKTMLSVRKWFNSRLHPPT